MSVASFRRAPSADRGIDPPRGLRKTPVVFHGHGHVCAEKPSANAVCRCPPILDGGPPFTHCDFVLRLVEHSVSCPLRKEGRARGPAPTTHPLRQPSTGYRPPMQETPRLETRRAPCGRNPRDEQGLQHAMEFTQFGIFR
jgi:hypothetical protein